MIKNIIFDYDGTISKTNDIKTQAFANIFQEYGIDIINQVVNHHVNNQGMDRFQKFKFYHKEYLNRPLSNYQLNKISKQFSKTIIEKVIEAPFVDVVYDFIKENYTNYNFYISTATPQREMIEILKKKKILYLFIEVYGSPSSKIDHIKEIIEKNIYKKYETIFVGDSTDDYNSSLSSGIKFINVSKGKYLEYMNDRFYDMESILKKFVK